MATRTTKSSVTFLNSFTLGDFDVILPSGTYDVETDEELLEGLSFHAYRRVSTVIFLPAKSGNPAFTRALTIDPADLDAALKRDAPSSTAAPDRMPGQKPFKGARKTPTAKTDRLAKDRAEDEGMIVRSV